MVAWHFIVILFLFLKLSSQGKNFCFYDTVIWRLQRLIVHLRQWNESSIWNLYTFTRENRLRGFNCHYVLTVILTNFLSLCIAHMSEKPCVFAYVRKKVCVWANVWVRVFEYVRKKVCVLYICLRMREWVCVRLRKGVSVCS